MRVICQPNVPQNTASATSLIKGEVIRKDSVTPNFIRDCTNPTNSGRLEQEQNGVMAPNPDARR